jgi:uncharacterized protein YkwD
MRESARPVLLGVKKFPLVVPNTLKIFLVINLLLLSYLSGQSTFLNESGRKGPTFAQVEQLYSEAQDQQVRGTASIRDASLSAQFNIIQIKQIAIGQRAAVRPTPTPIPTNAKPVSDSEKTKGVWGVAERIDEYTYTMQVEQDPVMGSAQEILTALNSYRQRHGSGPLSWDDKLADFAKSRANFFIEKNTLDSHAGFLDYVNNQDGFKKLGFYSVGENSSLGFNLTGVHLIEWVYAGDEGHNNNQLNKDWQYVGIGVNGTATDVIFAGSRM